MLDSSYTNQVDAMGSPSGLPGPSRHQVSVLVPTRNEKDNVQPLITRLTASLRDLDAEILFLDDSEDGTVEAIRAAAAAAVVPIRLIHRASRDRVGGLGGAVKAGLLVTDADWVVVMDGDLQHPPEVIPLLLEAGRPSHLDLVVASRYCGHGDASGLSSRARRSISSGATILAGLLLPHVRSSVTDPMSGFFAVRRSSVDPSRLNPDGFKILLEILVRCAPQQVAEVPFTFAERHRGDSKADPREGVRYLRQLLRLRRAIGSVDGPDDRHSHSVAYGLRPLMSNLFRAGGLARRAHAHGPSGF